MFRKLRRTRLQANKDDDDNEETPRNPMDILRSPVANVTEAARHKILLLRSSNNTVVANATEMVAKVSDKIGAWTDAYKSIVVSFVTGLIVATATLLSPLLLPSSDQVPDMDKSVALFSRILSDLSDSYVDTVQPAQLTDTAVKSMLASLDPYTEYYSTAQESKALTESIEGRYGGVGLVISGNSKELEDLAPEVETTVDSKAPSSPVGFSIDDSDGEDDSSIDADAMRQRIRQRQAAAKERGIQVVSAMEGYAFDYGLRVGDKIVAVDGKPATTVEQVRNQLRGEPGSYVTIDFERQGVAGIQSVQMPRTVVRMNQVPLATLIDPAKSVGYIRVSAFASDTGPQVRKAILALQRAAEDAAHGESSLKGLVLDLRSNPGGLLTSAVDVCSMLVPKGSDIVSAKGRGFPGVLYRSRVDPILDTTQTKLVVLVNGQTASAAEIVSGAVQDLDVGVVVGSGRTYGKGLVQNVEDLPFDTALKYTVAKYYTPSGRCIQGVKYTQGGSEEKGNSRDFVASKVAEKDRSTFYTRTGRVVRDGGGIEADLKVQAPRASALEVTLLRSGIMSEFAAQWSKGHDLNDFVNKGKRLEVVDEDTYKQFQTFCFQKQKQGELDLDALYSRPLLELKKTLQQSGYKGSAKSVDQLQARIVRDVEADFETFRKDIKEDLSQNILARYLPESMLLERGLNNDVQVSESLKLIQNSHKFDTLLAREIPRTSDTMMSDGSIKLATQNPTPQSFRIRLIR